MRILTAVLCTALAVPAAAITNIEEKRGVKDEDGWKSRLELGFDLESGNTDQREWSIAANTAWQNRTDRFFAWLDRSYESTNGTKSDDNTFFHGRFVHNHLAEWSQEAFAQYERDPFDALMYRALVGTGVRHGVRLSADGRWYQGIGLFHEQVREQDEEGEYTNQLTRANLYTHLQWQLAHSLLQTTLYFQPSIDEPSDQRALLQMSVTMPMSASMDLKWLWQSSWDTEPPEGTEYQNHQTQLRFVIRF